MTGISTFTLASGWIELITCEPCSCLPPAVTVTSTLTFVSWLEPVSSTVTVNVGLQPPPMWFSVGSGCSVVVPTATPTSELPCVPGRPRPPVARFARQPRFDGVRFQPAEVRQEAAALRRLVDPVGVERFLDQRRDPLRVDHVGGQEDLHVAGDLRAACLLCPPERRREQRGDLRDRLRRGSPGPQEVRCAPVMSPGTLSPLARVASFCASTRSWLTCTSTSSADLPCRARSAVKRGLDDLRLGFARDFPRPRGCSPSATALLRFQAAVDDQDDDDQQHDGDAGGDPAADHQRVLVVARAARPARPRGRGRGALAARPGGGARLPTRGVSPSSKNDKSLCSLCRSGGPSMTAGPLAGDPATSPSPASPARAAGAALARRRTREPVESPTTRGETAAWRGRDAAGARPLPPAAPPRRRRLRRRLARARRAAARDVAVKRIGLGRRAPVAERAAREAQATARLSHPAIVALYEACRARRAFYLISELVHGRDARRADRRRASSRPRRAADRRSRSADALEHAHARGVVHRDIKPQNVLVPERRRGEAGIAKLTDFGGATPRRRGRAHPHRRRARHARLHGARAERGPRGGRARPTCTRSRSSSTRRCPASTPSAARRRRDRAADRHAAGAARAARRDLPGADCAALDPALPRARTSAARSTSCAALEGPRRRRPLRTARRPTPHAPQPAAPQPSRDQRRSERRRRLAPPRRAPAIPSARVRRGRGRARRRRVTAEPAASRPDPAPRSRRAATALVVLSLPPLGCGGRGRASSPGSRRRAAGRRRARAAAALPPNVLRRAPAAVARAGAGPGARARRPRRRSPRSPGRRAAGASGRARRARLLVAAARRAAARAASVARDRAAAPRRADWEGSIGGAASHVVGPLLSSGTRSARCCGRSARWRCPGSCAAAAPRSTSLVATAWSAALLAAAPALDSGLPRAGAHRVPAGPCRRRCSAGCWPRRARPARPRIASAPAAPARSPVVAWPAGRRGRGPDQLTMNLLKASRTRSRTRRGRLRSAPSAPRCARWNSRASWRARWTPTAPYSVSRVYAPNEYVVWLSPEDRERYEGVEGEVIDELCAYLLEHARRENLILAVAARHPSAPTSGSRSGSSGSRRSWSGPRVRVSAR